MASSANASARREASGGLGPDVVEASAKVLDEGMPGEDDPGGAISLQPPHGPEPSLEPSVVDLDGIVGMDLRFMEGHREHLVGSG
jgi:hypothetical protein